MICNSNYLCGYICVDISILQSYTLFVYRNIFYPNENKFLLELKISVNEYLGVISADGKKT